MAVVYRYSGEYTKRINKAASFEISEELIDTTVWQLTAKADSILDGITYLIIAIPLFDSIIPIGQVSSYVSSFYYPLDIGGRAPGNRWQFRNNNKTCQFYTYGEWENSVHFKPTEGQAISTRATGIVYEWREEYIYSYTGRRIYVFPDPPFDYFWYPANGTRVYTLRVFDRDGIEMSSISRTSRPITVFVIKDFCPVDTCEVDCGNHICCYGSDGIASYSYLK